MAWIIAPKCGLGPLHLGMSPDRVAGLPAMGRPEHVYRGSGGRRMEYRGLALPICEYLDDALTRIVAGRHVAGVLFEGQDLFRTAPCDLFRKMEACLGPATLCQEQLCFTDAGLMLGGFYDAHDRRFFEPEVEYHDERYLTVLAPGSCGGSCERHEAVSFA